MNRVNAKHYTLTAPNGATLHLVNDGAWWIICNANGGAYGARATIPAARRFVLDTFR